MQLPKEQYSHYIAVDWAQSKMAVARMTGKSNKITVFEGPADIGSLKAYLSQLKGTKIVTIEETTTTQWLYTELAGYADKILVCDPYRNRLLSEGAKTDKIDASKLVQLLKAGLLKEVYHSAGEFVYLRRIVSGYDDLIKAGVRLKNQRHALLRAGGKTSEKGAILDHPSERFVLKNLERRIMEYERDKEEYRRKFEELGRKHKEIAHQRSLPGIDWTNAIKVVARVVTPGRFPAKGNYLSYCGLVKLDRLSGGKSYGKKNPRFCRTLKSVYKMAAMTAIKAEGPMRSYYEYLMKDKSYPEYQARHAVARKMAISSLGVFRSGKKYTPNERKKPCNEIGSSPGL